MALETDGQRDRQTEMDDMMMVMLIAVPTV